MPRSSTEPPSAGRRGRSSSNLLLDHEGSLPTYAVVTEGQRPEILVAKALTFAPGPILVLDRGYVDYAWFATLTLQRVFFVTRLKANAVYAVVGTRTVPANRRIVKAALIALTGMGAAEQCPSPLRRVEVLEPETEETLVFRTNHLTFGATTIAQL